jgi:hypothetical protein
MMLNNLSPTCRRSAGRAAGFMADAFELTRWTAGKHRASTVDRAVALRHHARALAQHGE